MAKRSDDTKRPAGITTTTDDPGATTGDALEQRVIAFAEQLGRIAGTVYGKAEGWMDREALMKQIASVRDGAADLLEHLAGAAKSISHASAVSAPPAAGTRRRSGGAVDAPGKKHRKAMPADPGASQAASQAAKMRTAKTMVKTSRRRGRG